MPAPAARPLHRRPDRGALRDHPGRPGDRRRCWTIALLIADSILGSLLMRSQGRAAWRRFNEALAAGRVPAREVARRRARHLRRRVPAHARASSPTSSASLLLLPPTRAVVRRVLVAPRSRCAVVGGDHRRARRAAAASAAAAPGRRTTTSRAPPPRSTRRTGCRDRRPRPTRRRAPAPATGFSDAVTVRLRRRRGARSTALARIGPQPDGDGARQRARRCCSPAASRWPCAPTAASRPRRRRLGGVDAAGVRDRRSSSRCGVDASRSTTATAHGFALDLRGARRAGRLDADELPPASAAWRATSSSCRVHGTVARRRRRARSVDCLGQRGHSWGAPDWDRMALARTRRRLARRTTAALTLPRCARPRRKPARRRGGLRRVAARAATRSRAASPTRALSTTYDGEGRQRRAGPGAVGRRGRRLRAPRGRRGRRAARRSTSAACAWTARSSAGAWRAARAPAATTSCGAPDADRTRADRQRLRRRADHAADRRRSRSSRRRPASRPRRSASRCDRADERTASNPLFELERGRMTEADSSTRSSARSRRSSAAPVVHARVRRPLLRDARRPTRR